MKVFKPSYAGGLIVTLGGTPFIFVGAGGLAIGFGKVNNSAIGSNHLVILRKHLPEALPDELANLLLDINRRCNVVFRDLLQIRLRRRRLRMAGPTKRREILTDGRSPGRFAEATDGKPLPKGSWPSPWRISRITSSPANP